MSPPSQAYPGELLHLSAATRRALDRAVTALADSPIPVSLCITGIVGTSLLAVGAKVGPAVVGMVLTVTFASYAIDRLFDRTQETGRSQLRTPLAGAAAALFASCLAFAHALGGARVAAFALFFPLAVAAYCMPWLGSVPALARRGIRRVKDIPYTKNFYTAFCIMLAALWAALAVGVREPGKLAAVAACAFFADFVNTAACDLGDVEADRKNGVPTFAVLFGRERVARALTWLSHAWALALVAGALVGALAPAALFAASGTLLVRAYLTRLARPDTPRVFGDVVPDLTDAAIGLLALLGSNVVGV